MPGRYAKSPSWTISHDGVGSLLVSGGADALFEIDDVPASAAAEILASWHSGEFAPEGYSLGARDVFEQLLTVNAVSHRMQPATIHTIALHFCGPSHPELERELARQLPARVTIGDGCAPDLVVLVRTAGTLRDVVGDGCGAGGPPQLLFDIAYEHTVSLGPLVFFGDTACLDCYVSRLTTYWGDPLPPPVAAIQLHPAMIAGILALNVSSILTGGDRALINATVAYDFTDHRVARSSIYKLPMCPSCGAGSQAAGGGGQVDLPWAAAAR